jgi:riboflavin synthase
VFTGLIEQQGLVVDNYPLGTGRRFIVSAPFTQVSAGESIAVNGVCLTVLPADTSGENLAFDISPETLALTTLGTINPGESVNLERALLAGSRMGGHYVSGHVDTTATVHAVQQQGEFFEVIINNFGPNIRPNVMPKGSITLDGVSLTINSVADDSITVMLVPHTLAMTTLGSLKTGRRINVEFDYLARVIAHQVASYLSHTSII